MCYKNKVNRFIFIFVISVLAATLLFFIGSKIFSRVFENINEKRIQPVISSLGLGPDKAESDLEKLYPLLDYYGLSYSQKGEVYLLICTSLLTKGDIHGFFDNLGQGIFYNEKAGNTDNAVFLYSLLAGYFLGIGADKPAYKAITTARSIKTFTQCQSPVTRIQANKIYVRFLISENDFEDARKAVWQIIDDVELLRNSAIHYNHDYFRDALALEALIQLEQGKTEEAYKEACDILEIYGNQTEDMTPFQAFDFYMPVYYIKTQRAVRTKRYEEAISYNEEYEKLCEKFGFLVAENRLCRDIMFALPPSMKMEKERLFNKMALQTQQISDSVLDNYTDFSCDKFSSIIGNLKYKAELDEINSRIFQRFLVEAFVFLILLLLINEIYTRKNMDSITHLWNRKKLDAKLKRLRAGNHKYSAIVLDVDDFSELENKFGTDFGEHVMKIVAREVLRNERSGVKCYRYNNRKIVILLENYNLERTVRIAESTRYEIARLKWAENINVTASLGVGASVYNPLEEADRNLNLARKKGKNFTAYRKNGEQFLAERRIEIRNFIGY